MERPCLAVLLLLAFLAAAPARAQDYDVVVYGGTSGGVIAAVQAQAMGRSAILVEPTRHLGGMTVTGLGATDIGNQAAIGGRAREFYRAVRAHYARDAAWVHEAREDFRGRGHRPGEDAAWTFEPHVAERILGELVARSGIAVSLGDPLDRSASGLEKDGAVLRAIRLRSGRRIAGRVFLDATYEGDLFALAGCSYTVGREANATHGETLNGVQTQRAVKHQFVVDVDPWRVPGDPSSGLLPEIQAGGPGEEGGRDARVQAYCFRICATDVPANRVPWPQPANYDAGRYELLLRNFEAGDSRIPWHPVWMPNRKTDSNNNFAVSTDVIGRNHAYPEASDEERAAILEDHLAYTQGLFWTLANHPRVPAPVREHFQRFGLARDEFVDHGHWPWTFYVREGRRLVGELVMTEHHCRGTQVVPDAVGLGAYGMDSHNVQRYVDAQGRVRNEGDVQVHGFEPYPIAYRALLPKRSECENLLVPVALSASHIAFGSIRMEPVFMILGQSAATAACLALERGVALHDLPYEALRERLLADGQVLAWVGARGPVEPGVRAADLPGVVVDDERAQAVGGWVRSASVRPFVEAGYRHDGDEEKGRKTMRFTLRAPRAGTYVLRLAYTPHANRARAVPVVVERAGSRAEVAVDQTAPPPRDGLWIDVARLTFVEPETFSVTISNAGTRGFVVVDALWLAPADE